MPYPWRSSSIPARRCCRARNQGRPDRTFGAHVIRNQTVALRRGMRSLRGEGFRHIYKLNSQADGRRRRDRPPAPLDRPVATSRGPFDIIGDVHGCAGELEGLLGRLGYAVERAERDGEASYRVTPPLGRKAVFVGDLVDRGPRIVDTLRLVMAMVEDGAALCVLGNHEAKFDRWLQGREVKPTHGLDRSIAELGAAPDPFRDRVRKFIAGMVSHYMLDGGRLAVAHAGIKEEMQGRASGAIRSFCLYGETTGEIDEFGLPVRLNWATAYRGDTKVVFGHTPDAGAGLAEQHVVHRHGLRLRRQADCPALSGAGAGLGPGCPGLPGAGSPARWSSRPAGSAHDRKPTTCSTSRTCRASESSTSRLIPSITIREENTAAALEVMSRFAIDPRWLIYLPPTMSPCETSTAEGYPRASARGARVLPTRGPGHGRLPGEAHGLARAAGGLPRRATRPGAASASRPAERGAIWTRSGRPFFIEPAAARGRAWNVAAAALDRSGLFDELQTDWVLLDCEIMPWSFKAEAS